jgi:hypothetical protein
MNMLSFPNTLAQVHEFKYVNQISALGGLY